jgi:lysophospholipase L1-like esterase
MIARLREWASRAALVALSCGTVLAGLEAWLATRDLPRDRGQIAVAHPDSPRLVRLAPEAEAISTGVPVRTNRFGYRGPQWETPKPPSRFRIAVLGDSQTFGFGVREEDTYPARLERRLRDAFPDRQWDVLNFGMVGFTTAQEAELCSLDVRPHAPDLVLVGFFLNDVDAPVRQSDVVPAEPDPASPPPRRARRLPDLRRSRSWQFLRMRAAALGRRVGVAHGTTTARYVELFASRSPAWRACEEGLRALRDETARNGASLAVCVLPLIVNLDETYPMAAAHRQVVAFCEAEGIACVDLLPAFLGRDPERLMVSPINNHMNAEGNEIAADALFEWLRGSGLLERPLRP